MMFLQLGREHLLKIFSKQHCNYEDEIQIHAVIFSILRNIAIIAILFRNNHIKIRH